MGGHDILLAEMAERAMAPEKERQLNRRLLIREAKAAKRTQPGTVTWFGGIKATAAFLRDSAQAAFANRRMTEAH
jgi:hypothetical protein